MISNGTLVHAFSIIFYPHVTKIYTKKNTRLLVALQKAHSNALKTQRSWKFSVGQSLTVTMFASPDRHFWPRSVLVSCCRRVPPLSWLDVCFPAMRQQEASSRCLRYQGTNSTTMTETMTHLSTRRHNRLAANSQLVGRNPPPRVAVTLV